jgi:tetratricopeptide (TPR) repeat protein
MTRIGMNYLVVGAAVLMALPSAAYAQEDCVTGSNSAIRSAEVEFGLASSRNDTRSAEERYRRALEKLERNWELDDPPGRSYLLAAHAYLGLFDFAGADSMLTTLVGIEPSCADQVAAIRFSSWVTQYNAGIEQMQADNADVALERFETANLINRDARSLAYAGSIYQTRGDNETAATLYESALAAGGSDDIVRTASINLAGIRKMAGDDAGALEIYSAYATSYPEDILGRLNFAIALMDADRGSEAETIFEGLLSRDDLSFGQWSQVGIGLYRAQNFEQAAVAFGKALELNPHNKETLENLANSHYQVDNYESLMPFARLLVEAYPLERVNFNLLANSLRELGDSDAALAVLEARDAMSVEFLSSRFSPVGPTTYSVDGQMMNRIGAAGSTYSVAVTFLDEEGAEAMTETLELTLPAEGEIAAFSLQVENEAPIVGFRYASSP